MEGSLPNHSIGVNDDLTRVSFLSSIMSPVPDLGFVDVLIFIHHVLLCCLFIDVLGFLTVRISRDVLHYETHLSC
jgi:hypothetical protein